MDLNFKEIPLKNILFLDIETVPAYPDYGSLPGDWKELWDKKASYIAKNDESEEETYSRSAIYAEFGKIVAVSVAIVKEKDNGQFISVKTIYGDDEKCILKKLASLLNKYYSDGDKYLCAHNGKEFDFPYLARRMLVNNIPVPKILDTHGKKPWEVTHLDTMELWKFGDYKHFTSLRLLARLFDLPDPKSETDGSQIARIFWQEKDYDRIKNYCEQDTITVIQLFLKFRNEKIIPQENIEILKSEKCITDNGQKTATDE